MSVLLKGIPVISGVRGYVSVPVVPSNVLAKGNESTGTVTTSTPLTYGSIVSTQDVSFAASPGPSYLFNTTNGGYMDIAQTDFNTTQKSWTGQLWFYPTSINRYLALFNARPPTADAYAAARFDITAGTAGFFKMNMLASTTGSSWDLGSSFPTTGEWALNQWHHLAVVYTLAGRIRFFIDGVFQRESPITSVTYRSGRHMLGAGSATAGGYSPSTNRFRGYIQDMQFLDGQALYSANFTPPARGTIS